MSKAKGEATPMSEAKQAPEVKPAAPMIDPSVAALIRDIVVEARKPVKTEKEIRAEQELVDHREAMRAEYAQKRINTAHEQTWCQHKHKSGVGTPVTYIASINRLYCQHCHLWIFQTINEAAQNGSLVDPAKHPELWNRHFDSAISAEAI